MFRFGERDRGGGEAEVFFTTTGDALSCSFFRDFSQPFKTVIESIYFSILRIIEAKFLSIGVTIFVLATAAPFGFRSAVCGMAWF